MILINIKTNFRLIAKLIDSESLYYLIIKNIIPDFNSSLRTVTIEEWRDIENPSESLENFTKRLENEYWKNRKPDEGEEWKGKLNIKHNNITDIEINKFKNELTKVDVIKKFQNDN
jgi:hypothetical protein